MAAGRAALPAPDFSFIEPLAQAIRQETELKGISIRGEKYRVSLHADDVLVTLRDPGSGLPILMKMLETY